MYTRCLGGEASLLFQVAFRDLGRSVREAILESEDLAAPTAANLTRRTLWRFRTAVGHYLERISGLCRMSSTASSAKSRFSLARGPMKMAIFFRRSKLKMFDVHTQLHAAEMMNVHSPRWPMNCSPRLRDERKRRPLESYPYPRLVPRFQMWHGEVYPQSLSVHMG